MAKVTDLFYYKYGTFSLQLFVINLKPSTHHLPRLALLFAGGVIFVYLMEEIKMLLLLNAPTHTIAGVQELYQQLLPTKVYYNRKTKSQVTNEKCRLRGDSLENVQHILSGCSPLAQTKFLQRHNNAFKIVFFEVLRSLDLITKVSRGSHKSHPSRCMRMSMRPPSGTSHYSLIELQ